MPFLLNSRSKGIALAGLVLAMAACRKEPGSNQPVVDPHEVAITVQNTAGHNVLKLEDAWYQTANGDSIRFHAFKYYVSNITLHGAGGLRYDVPESYFLVNEQLPASKDWMLNDIPFGNYTSMSFLIGVDSARNTTGAQTGALDPNNAMFWDWNSGYIMAKIEATSPQAGNTPENVAFHMGGFKGPYSVLRRVTVSFPETLRVADGKTSAIDLQADVLEWFKTPTTIDVSQVSIITGVGAEAAMIADNYADMFTVTAVE